MAARDIMIAILGQLVEDIHGKYRYKCMLDEGTLNIEAYDGPVGVRYIDDQKVEVTVEYVKKPRFETRIPVADAPQLILELLGERKPKPWWRWW